MSQANLAPDKLVNLTMAPRRDMSLLEFQTALTKHQFARFIHAGRIYFKSTRPGTDRRIKHFAHRFSYLYRRTVIKDLIVTRRLHERKHSLLRQPKAHRP